MARLRKSAPVARTEEQDGIYSQHLCIIFCFIIAIALTIKLRNKKEYTTSNSQQGRRGREQCAFEGVKHRKKQRRSTRISNDTTPPDEDTATSPPTPPRQRRIGLRSDEIRCLTYGPNRKALYPQYHMCMGCDALEKDRGLVNAKVSESSKFYRCTAGHTHPCFPTEPKKDCCKMLRTNPNESNNDYDSTDSDDTSDSETNNQETNDTMETGDDDIETDDDESSIKEDEEGEIIRLEELATVAQRRMQTIHELTQDNSELIEQIETLKTNVSTLKEYNVILEKQVQALTKKSQTQKRQVTRLRNKVATGVDKTKSLADNIVDNIVATVHAYGLSPARHQKLVGEEIA